MASYYDLGTSHVGSTSSSTPPWVIDSGTSNHVTSIRSGFTLYTTLPSLGTVKVANGNHTEVLGEGTIDVYNTLSSTASAHLEMFFLKFF